jgi:hypothetical protein
LIGPSRGSALIQRTAAGVASSAGTRISAHFWFSAETPTWTFRSGQMIRRAEWPSICCAIARTSSANFGSLSSARILACRLVSTWNVCCGQMAITAKASVIKSRGTSS